MPSSLRSTIPALGQAAQPLGQQGRFSENLHTGERFWWEDTSPDWIAGVAGTGRPFYTRLVPGGLARAPGLEEVLTAGARVVDTACGAGQGVLRLATAYPHPP